MITKGKILNVVCFVLCLYGAALTAQEVRVIDNKGTIQTVTVNNVTEAATAPATPVEGDVWFDTATNISKIYDTDTTSWITIDPDSVTVDATAPATPAEGDIWFDTTENLTKVWDGTSTWEPIKASTAYSLWDNDQDTGIQVEEGGPGTDDDTIRFDTANAERMVIDPLGNVGIGVSAPEGKLHVEGNTAKIILSDKANAGNNLGLMMYHGGATGKGIGVTWNDFIVNQVGGLLFQSLDNNGNYSANLGVMTRAGNFGIGTTDPAANLDITSPGETKVLIHSSENDDAKLEFLHSAELNPNNVNHAVKNAIVSDAFGLWKRGDMRFVLNAAADNTDYDVVADTRMMIGFNGNVGIGITSNPTAKLDVNGQARIRTLPVGAATDQVVTANADGDLRKQSITDIVASAATSFRTVTTNTTLIPTDGTVVVRAVATTAITLTLPLASDLPQGGYLTIKRLDDTATPAAVNIVAGNATDTIDGNTNAAYTTQLATNAAKMTLQSDGVSAWYIISE